MKLGPEIVVVPTERHVERATVEGTTSTSARRFFEKLRDAVDPDRKPASAALMKLLAKRAMQVDPEATAAERAGIGAAADATISMLARSGAGANEIAATGTARGRRIAEVARAMDTELSRLGLADPRRPPLALDGCAELPERVTIDGVVDLDGAQIDAWLAVHRAIVARGGRGVRLRLPRFEHSFLGAQPRGPEEAVAKVAEGLEARLSEEHDAFEIEWVDRAAPRATTVIEAHGEGSEARAVAALVAAALERGAKPDRIFIVAPSRDEALVEPLRAALRDAGVAASDAWGPPVEAAPEARSVLALIAMAVGRMDRDALIELLHTPGLHPGVLVRDREEATAVRRAALLAARLSELPVVQDRDGRLFIETLRASMSESEDGSPEDFWMVSAMEKLAESASVLRRATTVERFTGALLDLIDRLRLGEPSAPEIRRALTAKAGGASAMRAIAEGAVAVRAVRVELESLREAYRSVGATDEPADLAEIALELEHALTSARTAARGAAGRAGAVRVGELRETLGLEHDLLVITKMAGRSYAPEPRAGLLDEATRRALPRAHRPRSHRERSLIREAEIAWAMASSTDVALAFSSTDREGREAEPPHPRVVEALAAGAERRVEPSSRLASSASQLAERASELTALGAGAPPSSDLVARVHIERERQAFFADPATPPGAFTGLVSPRFTERLIAHIGGSTPERAVGVTFVERAYACPFRAFADRVLRARRADDIQDVVGPRERGELLHKALFEAFEEDRDRSPSATVEQRIDAARTTIARVLEVDGPASPLRREGKAAAARDAALVFEDEIRRDDDFVYVRGEQGFGARYAPPWGPLAIDSPRGERVYVEGRIDRIDATPGGLAVRVVDYKTGRAKAKRFREGDFQVPLYALVAKQSGAAETSGVYVAIGAGGASALVPTKPGDRVLDDAALALISSSAAAAVARTWTGAVAPRPASLSVCKYCDARDLCRRPAVMPESVDEDG